jgi:hypothetical protein
MKYVIFKKKNIVLAVLTCKPTKMISKKVFQRVDIGFQNVKDLTILSFRNDG